MSNQKDKGQQSDAHNARGIELAEKGWLDEAVNEFGKAITLDPLSIHAYGNLATVLGEKKQFLKAFEILVDAFKKDAKDPQSAYFLASFLSSKTPALIEQLFLHAIELDPEFTEAYTGLCDAYIEIEDYAKAREIIEKAIAIDPFDLQLKQELAVVFVESGQYAEAIATLKKVVKEDPQLIDAWLDIGMAYSLQGFYDESEKSLFKALELDPESLTAHFYLMHLYWLSNRRDESLNHLKKAIEIQPASMRHLLEEDDITSSLKQDPEFANLIELLFTDQSKEV